MANRGARVSIIEQAPVYSALSGIETAFPGFNGAFQADAFNRSAFWTGSAADSGQAMVSIIEIRPVYANVAGIES